MTEEVLPAGKLPETAAQATGRKRQRMRNFRGQRGHGEWAFDVQMMLAAARSGRRGGVSGSGNSEGNGGLGLL